MTPQQKHMQHSVNKRQRHGFSENIFGQALRTLSKEKAGAPPQSVPLLEWKSDSELLSEANAQISQLHLVLGEKDKRVADAEHRADALSQDIAQTETQKQGLADSCSRLQAQLTDANARADREQAKRIEAEHKFADVFLECKIESVPSRNAN